MQKKRFIAGAVCPNCGTLDTVFILTGGERESRHCTRCDLSEERPLPDDGAAHEPAEWQPVRLPGE